MATMTGGKAVATLLRDYGVKYVFGVPGGQTYPIYVGIHELAPDIRHVLFRCEKCAAMAAEAYGRMTGRPGVCDGTAGPGATNLVSGVAEAMASSTPLIAITSDVHTWLVGRSAAQECDLLGIFRPIVKAGFYVNRADKIPELVRRAFRIATSGRPGPVLLDFPADVVADQMDYGDGLYAETEYSCTPAQRVAPDPAAIERAADALVAARQPVVVAGGGVLTSRAWDELRALAELMGLPVITSIMGKGSISEDHPLSLGVGFAMYEPSPYYHLRGLDILAEADLVLFVGHRTDQTSTAEGHMPRPGTKIVHIDVDPQEIGRNYPTAVGVVGDAKLALHDLVAALKRRGARRAWPPQVTDSVRLWRQRVARRLASDEVPITPHRVVKEIQEAMPPEGILVCDASLPSFWGSAFYDVRRAGRAFFAPRGMAGIGNGLPAAIGAKLAAPERPVIGLGGDGGFAMAIHELETMRRVGIPAVYVVLNNSVLGWGVLNFRTQGLPIVSCDFTPLNYANLARNFGCFGARVERPGDLGAALRTALASGQPAVIDVVTTNEYPTHDGGARLV